MPWESDRQRRWGHSQTGIKDLGGRSAVKEWDNASRGKKLMETKKGELLDAYAKPSEMEELTVPTPKPRLGPKPESKPQPKPQLKKEELCMALDKAGYRESALNLKNWDEEDDMAKKLRKELEGSDSIPNATMF